VTPEVKSPGREVFEVSTILTLLPVVCDLAEDASLDLVVTEVTVLSRLRLPNDVVRDLREDLSPGNVVFD